MTSEIIEFDAGGLSDEVVLDSLEPKEIASVLLSTATVGDLREIMAHNLEMCKVSTKATHIRWLTDLLKTLMEINSVEAEVVEESAEVMIRRIVANHVFAAGYGELVANELKGYVDADLR